MAHYIDKEALVAEIERRMKNLTHEMSKFYYASNYNEWKFVVSEYKSLISFINTLEIKEVDLEKELDKFYGMYRDKNGVTHDMQDNEICLDWKEDCNYHFKIEFAKHFFELGLKAKQG